MPVSLPCPPWEAPEPPDKVQHVVSEMAEFHRFIFKNAKQKIIDHGEIKTWHGRIFRLVVPVSYYAGNYRCDDSSKPCLAVNVGVPPNPGAPYKEVTDLMKSYSEELRDKTIKVTSYINRGSVSPIEQTGAVVQLVAFSVGRLSQIHPFINGSGRMSRLVANYVLHRFDYRMLHPHPYNRPVEQEYAQAAADCMRGNFNRMFQFILTSLAAASIAWSRPHPNSRGPDATTVGHAKTVDISALAGR